MKGEGENAYLKRRKREGREFTEGWTKEVLARKNSTSLLTIPVLRLCRK